MRRSSSSRCLRAYFGEHGRPGLLAAMFDPRLGAGVAAIHARWAEPLTLQDIAKAAGMSRSAFASGFATTAGVTPMAYLAEWRLLKGREMLADRALSIAQIAAACGHRSTEGFSRAFRRLYSQSPTALRNGGASRPSKLASASAFSRQPADGSALLNADFSPGARHEEGAKR